MFIFIYGLLAIEYFIFVLCKPFLKLLIKIENSL